MTLPAWLIAFIAVQYAAISSIGFSIGIEREASYGFGSDFIYDKKQRNEIDRLFKTARNQQWDEGTFMEALKGTSWWQSTLPSLRQFFIETNDPRNAATFAEKLQNNIESVSSKLEALGISIKGFDDTTGRVIDNSQFLEGVAMEAIKNNWNDDDLESYLATKGNLIFSGGGALGVRRPHTTPSGNLPAL